MASKKKAARRASRARKRRNQVDTDQNKIDRILRIASVIEEIADAVEGLPDKKPLQEISLFQATEKLHEQLKRIHG